MKEIPHKVEPKSPAYASPNYAGMSIRTEIAARAMQGLLSNSDVIANPKNCAEIAVRFADALIAELNKPTET